MTSPEFPDLTHFFAPRSVALIGATDDASKYAGRSMQLMLDFGYKGRVYPVNPKYKTVRGLDCYPSVKDLPEAPDHVSVVVPAERVHGVLEECAERGTKFATVLSSGFAETGTARGREMQTQLGELARRTGMRLMGPNCNGIVNFVNRFALSYTTTVQGPPLPRVPGNIGVVLLQAIPDAALRRHICGGYRSHKLRGRGRLARPRQAHQPDHGTALHLRAQGLDLSAAQDLTLGARHGKFVGQFL